MSKKVRLENLIELLKNGTLNIEGVRSLEIHCNGATIRINPREATVYCELEGNFSGSKLHRELVRLGLVKE